MVKATITPFLARSKSLITGDCERSQSPSSRPSSSSSVFPSLRRLDTSSTSPKPSSSTAGGTAQSSTATTSSSKHPPPLLSLRLSGPSFLDVVIKDRENKEPLYIIETVRDSTSIYRLNAETEEAYKAATVTWPNSITSTRNKSGRTVQIEGGRWRDTEEFLKLGPLRNVATRKFSIPHYPHSLKWKLIPGGHFYCTTAGAKGPFAILDCAVLNSPARLSIYHNCLEEDQVNYHENYKGIPVKLLDYLVTTALLLSTEVQEWLDRPQTASGTVRISGSSAPSVQKWLAIIHNTAIPSSPTFSSSEERDRESGTSSSFVGRRISGTSSLYGATTSEYPSTPSTPATSASTSFIAASSPDIPPVPPLPDIPRSPHPDNHQSSPFGYTFASQSTPQLALKAATSSAQLATMSTSSSSRPVRQLPRPPVLPMQTSHRPSWQTTENRHSNELIISGGSAAIEGERSPSPSVLSNSSSSTGSRRHSARSSGGRPLPPTLPPPSHGLPLPPKLAQELTAIGPSSSQQRIQRSSQTYNSSPLSQPNVVSPPPVGGSSLQATNPDPLSDEDEERIRELTNQMVALNAAESTRYQYQQPVVINHSNVLPPGGSHVDAGMVMMRNARARASYAETIYDLPPPAYDAIDFSLPHLRVAQNGR
ncbi:hypothetical protein C8Q75DRAFT_259652 [Abortiporus biennis]|nr:hypothetical protein C8Q75DRAFT_259652 [Abortiporus biennis]